MHSVVSLPSIPQADQGGSQCAQRGQTAGWSCSSQQAQHAQHLQPRHWLPSAQLMQHMPQPQHSQPMQHITQPQYSQQLHQLPHAPAECSWNANRGAAVAAGAASAMQGWAQQTLTQTPGLVQDTPAAIHNQCQQGLLLPQGYGQQAMAEATPQVHHAWYPALPGGYQPWSRGFPIQHGWHGVHHQHQIPLQQHAQQQQYQLPKPLEQVISGSGCWEGGRARETAVAKNVLPLKPEGSCQMASASTMLQLGSRDTLGSKDTALSERKTAVGTARPDRHQALQEQGLKHPQTGLHQQQQSGLIRAFNLDALLS